MPENFVRKAVEQIRSNNNLPPRNALRTECDTLIIRITNLSVELTVCRDNLKGMRELRDELNLAITQRESVEAELVEASNSASRSKSDIEQRIVELGV